MLRRKLFGSQIEPSCAYCEHGAPTRDGQSVLCEKRGVMLPSDFCRKFTYDPLARIPSRQAKLPSYEKEDFSL